MAVLRTGARLAARVRAPVAVRVLLLATGLTAAHGQQDAASAELDYRVKAAFLYNFAKFVHWPPAKLGADGNPIVVAVLGKDPFGELLDQTLRGKTVNGHPLAVRRLSGPADLKGCHIAFVSSSESGRLDKILRLIENDPVLTVGEMDHFARRGGMIGFTVEGGRTRLEVNRGVAQRAGLQMDSQFLRLAWVIEDDGQITGRAGGRARPSPQ